MPIFEVGHFEKMVKLFEELNIVNKNFKITGNFVFAAAVPEIVILSSCLVENLAANHH